MRAALCRYGHVIRMLLRTLAVAVVALAVLAALAIGGSTWAIDRLAHGRMIDRPEALPADDTALVLGTSPRVGRYDNPHFVNRIAAAADLFRRGRVRHLLLSGDNGHWGYDEPTAMRRALLALGVPASAMTLDDAGFRTLDSVARAKAIFGLQKMVIVTDRFHASRALFLARHFGIDAVAFPSRDVPLRHSVRSELREYLARVKALLDVYVLHTGPHFPATKTPPRKAD